MEDIELKQQFEERRSCGDYDAICVDYVSGLESQITTLTAQLAEAREALQDIANDSYANTYARTAALDALSKMKEGV